jgi:hypothetical protein
MTTTIHPSWFNCPRRVAKNLARTSLRSSKRSLPGLSMALQLRRSPASPYDSDPWHPTYSMTRGDCVTFGPLHVACLAFSDGHAPAEMMECGSDCARLNTCAVHSIACGMARPSRALQL